MSLGIETTGCLVCLNHSATKICGSSFMFEKGFNSSVMLTDKLVTSSN